ncbi:MAG: ORF6N domain-containing protein [Deltaproteobacteria bacterium]|nr:ORF6N domain-containing protein [Deltaproteobacteria bacterium]
MIERRILLIRCQKVMLDADLAKVYGTTTKALNQAVRRNAKRFPSDFMFKLTAAEKKEVVTNCDHLARLRFSPNLPFVFTEHGAIMAASVLNTERAVAVSVLVVRAFNRLRQMAASHEELWRKVMLLEKKYDRQFKLVFDAIDEIMRPVEPPRRRIGFVIDKEPSDRSMRVR